jgi:hypothetical protein
LDSLSNTSLYPPSYLPNFTSNLTRHFIFHHICPILISPNTSFLSSFASASLGPDGLSFYNSLDKFISYEHQTLFFSLSAHVPASFLFIKCATYIFPLFLLQPSHLSNNISAFIIYFPTMMSSPINPRTPSSLSNHLKPLFQCNKCFWIVTHHQPRNPANPFFYGVDVSCPFCEERLCWTVCFCCTDVFQL